MDILDKIVRYSLKWTGIEENPGNSGWEHDEFQKMMEQVGWEMGQAWCMYFVKMIWYQLYKKSTYGKYIMELLTGSATRSYDNCHQSPRIDTIIKNPVKGAIVIWRLWNDGVPDWRGHAGIIIEPGTRFKSIEGNTNNDGSRTGREVAIKDRVNNHGTTNANGLVVEGFIQPPIELDMLDSRKIDTI